jgi:hypothetical protein
MGYTINPDHEALLRQYAEGYMTKWDPDVTGEDEWFSRTVEGTTYDLNIYDNEETVTVLAYLYDSDTDETDLSTEHVLAVYQSIIAERDADSSDDDDD